MKSLALRPSLFRIPGSWRATLLLLLGALSSPVVAQTYPPGDPLPKDKETISLSPLVVRSRLTARQSQLNPAGQTHGDTTNRGRMSADFLWGITNANHKYSDPVYGRVPDLTEDSPLRLDGYTFPFPIGANGRRVKTDGMGLTSNLLYVARTIDDETVLGIVNSPAPPVTGTAPNNLGTVGGYTAGSLWAQVTGPTPQGGSGFIGNNYHSTPAVARPATALADPADPARTEIFAWYPTVPGTPGQYSRFAIRVHVPELADTTLGEGRISDARYIVYYVIPLGGNNFLRKRKVVFLEQDSAGDKWLVGDDGTPAIFPMLSESTYTSGTTSGIAYSGEAITLGDPRARARVELDNTTEGDTDGKFILADQIEFVERPATVKGTPVVTPPHGGRKVDTTQVVPAADPAIDPYDQPAKGPNNYGLNIGLIAGNLWNLNGSYNFINDVLDPAYSNPVSPLYGKYDPSNPSVLFRGPVSMIDPRDALNNSVAAGDAINQGQYRDALGNPVPYFSHMQVLVARTEFVIDPETNVPNSEKDGTKSLEVGCIYALDWVTGTPIWRWPDKSFLPQLTGGAVWRHPGNSVPVNGAALRNPLIANSPAVNLIPGVTAIDRNGDGLYGDDEIYIVGQGNNPNGGFAAGATIVPNIAVMGNVAIPTYTDLLGGAYQMTAVALAPEGRYARRDPADPTKWLPISMPVAFVASNNGVMYAIDPFGNNDNQYIENTADTTRLGTFRPGTTNLLWTFSPQSQPRVVVPTPGGVTERLDKYYQRLKGEIPPTGAFGASAPVVAWAKQSDDPTHDPFGEEPRLFIGNQNKVLYALDPRANAGIDTATTFPKTLPIRKGEQIKHNIATLPGIDNNVPEGLIQDYRKDLKWWFETLGPINTTVAISDTAFLRNAAALPVTNSRQVYLTTGEGRVYSLDWDGPVTKVDHEKNLVWDGTSGVNLNPLIAVPSTRPTPTTAAGLNDNIRFHNDAPALPSARPDLTEGTIRPTWAFPNRYADVRDDGINSAVNNRLGIDPPDASKAYAGSTRLATPFTNIGAIYSAPVVMDIAMADRDAAPAGLTGIRHYLVVSTNDYNTDAPDSPKQGRLFLLDQEGDRNDFLTNPMPSRATAKFLPTDPAVSTSRALGGPTGRPTPANLAQIYSQPLDQYVYKNGPFGKATPAWTYRFVYDTYDLVNKPLIARRGRPAPTIGIEPTTGEPARRTLPTVFVGGQGRLFAVDIDEETGLFQRWRKDEPVLPNHNQPTPLPTDDSVIIPGDEAAADLLNPSDTNNPASPIFNVGTQDILALRTKRVLARTVSLRGDGSSIDGQIVITGGPLQNRNNTTADTVALTLPQTVPPAAGATKPTVPLLPTSDAPITRSVLSLEPTVTVFTPLPVGYNLNPFGYDLSLTISLAPVVAFPEALFRPIVDLTGRYVNQDISDPLTTTRGSWLFSDAGAMPVNPTNTAFQYPSLLVTTAQGGLHEISTNVEGEDPSVATDPDIPGGGTDGNRFGALGWAFADGDVDRFNPNGHVLFFAKDGPGGSGTGISVLTNAYFPSLDSGYARRADRLTKQAANPTASYPFYPKDEPQSIATATYGDNPRPGFFPRPLYPGNAADGAATPPIAAVDPDYHTGQTGFPLDLQGLFYDRHFAPSTLTNHNADGALKLPAYDQQGTRSLVAPPTGVPETDQERYLKTLTVPPTAHDNDNAAGQNVTWIFVGGDDGIFYAYTPVFNASLGGVSTGFAGGRNNRGPGGLFGVPYSPIGGGGGGTGTPGIVTNPRVDIFGRDDFINMRNQARSGSNLIRPDRDGTEAAWVNTQESGTPGHATTNAGVNSVAARGGKNLYEWGESIYIVAWDLPVVASQTSTGVLSAPASAQVTITITPVGGGTPITRQIPLERATAGPDAGRVSNYPMVPRYRIPARVFAPGTIPAKLGMAFYEYRLDPSSGLPLTPGARFRVTVQMPTAPLGLNVNDRFSTNGTGGLEAARIAFLEPTFVVANPIAVQGFLTDTGTGTPVLPNKAAGDPVAGGIGPFLTPQRGNQLHPFRNRLATSTMLVDPDRANYEYSQALSNGNQIDRFDYDQYRTISGRLRINPSFGQRLRDSAGDDPSFFVPVAAATGYVGHGRTGSTDLSNRQRNLRILNRSNLESLSVRAEVMDDLIWRWWPGKIPNADLDLDDPVAGNGPITPSGMRHDGRMNPLPWEVDVPQAQPWKRRATSGPTGSVLGLGNISPDYPDITAASRALQGRQTISITMGGNDIVQGATSVASAQMTISPNPVNAISPFMDPAQPGYNLFSAAVGIRVPQFQPANLVATHNLTSTYEAPSTADGAQPFIGDGKVQLPRGNGNNASPRDLFGYDTGSGLFTGPSAITPFGYTTRIRVYVDAGSGIQNQDNNRQWDSGEPYRIVEVWTGVPVDMGLKSNETPLDLGALPAGFAQQNGLLGYLNGASNPGFLPDPLSAGYSNFFKKMTIQNTGNVNLYNLRAGQRFESLTDPANPAQFNPSFGSGNNFFYFGLNSSTVDPRFGVLSVGSDPNLAANGAFTPANVMPQVVTSLDPQFDAAWDAYYQTLPWMNQTIDNGYGGSTTPYLRYYQGMAGRHTLGKPRVGTTEPRVLGMPDVPSSTALVPVISPLQPSLSLPNLGISVPVGTPVGVYRSNSAAGSTGFPPQLAIYEDHDTNQKYRAVPILTGGPILSGGTISSAGPLYSGQNAQVPGLSQILPAGAEGVLRVRNFQTPGGALRNVEYLPHTNPAIDIKLTVTETPLTGQIPDFAGIGSDGIFSGLLPGIDPKPVLDNTNGLRPSATLSPAAYRGANGRLNLFFSRNAQQGGLNGDLGVGNTAPGLGFRLFHTHMNWNEPLGVFQASVTGVPLSDPNLNQARWFTPTQEIHYGALSNTVSDLYPSVLQIDPLATSATLFWVNSRPQGGGLVPSETIVWAPLDANGEPSAAAQSLLGTGNPNNQPDPTVRRYGPRAAFDAPTSTGFVFFYGGAPGKLGLYYIPYRGNASGQPLAAGGGRGANEIPIPIPQSITTASEPNGQFRRLNVVDHSPASPTIDGGATPVVDVIYTGVLRNTQVPDLFQSRFRMAGSGNGARLIATALPAIGDATTPTATPDNGERLVQVGRELAWRSRHIGWFVRYNSTTALVENLRIAAFRPNGVNTFVPLWDTKANAWQFDANSRRWVQVIRQTGGVLFVYVDTDTGEVRFRGAGEPQGTDVIVADYQPTTYRLTPDTAGDTGAFVTTDTRLLSAAPVTGVYRRLLNGMPNPMLSKETNPALSGVGRQWIVWGKSSQPGRPAHLSFATRRVGIDLKSVTTIQGMQRAESILLGARDAQGNQTPTINVQVNGANVPFDVDIATGRVFVDAFYEGMPVQVSYSATQGPAASVRAAVGSGRLEYLEELSASDTYSMGTQIPMNRSINESQVYGFVDLYNYDPSAGNLLRPVLPNSRIPNYATDPTLQPGRFWMFWTSSRPRNGRVPIGGVLTPLPNGFDLFYQTLAPNFESPTFSPF